MNKKAGAGKIFLFILILVILAAAIYFTFFFAYKCDDMTCFVAHQEKCSRTKFTNNAEEVTWEYNIKGKSGDSCEIEVEILQVKKGSLDAQKLENKKMNCYLPFGSTISPESDVSLCHGLLREEMQEMIIQKLHSYVLENIGQINEEFEKIV